MSKQTPPSPGAAPPEADDEQPPMADEGGSERGEPAKRDFLLFYSKKYYKVPSECVIVDYGKSVVVRDGKQAGELHECKSHPKWLSDGVHTRHLIKLKVGDRIGFYVTFKIEDEESDDLYIVRALHKSISKKFFEMWQKEWSDDKRAKFEELLRDEPSDESQMSPIALHWTMVDAPANVLYIRPPSKKKVDESEAEAPPAKKVKKAVAAKPRVEAAPDADEDDEDESAGRSTALVPVPSFPSVGAGGAGSANFFMQTPGTRAHPCVLVFHAEADCTFSVHRHGHDLGGVFPATGREPALVNIPSAQGCGC